MAGLMSFKIKVFQTNLEILPELEMKAKDLTPLFDQIIDEWARGNREKFQLAQGGESAGAMIDPNVSWAPLSPGYLRWKQRHFPTGTLMVRTGALRAALTDPQGFFRMVEPEQAIFGSPNDADDVMKVQGNWAKRQVIFLGDSDQRMIDEKTQKYFTVQMQSMKEVGAQLDADFAATVG